MNNLQFEYKVTLAYLITGALWILFSDEIAQLITKDIEKLNHIQTYKGWFYVLITALVFFSFLKKHLNYRRELEEELKLHRGHLEELVVSRTNELEKALANLKSAQAKLVQSEKMSSIGNLTKGIAHEINNPLHFISGGIKILEKLQEEIKNKDAKNINQLYSKAVSIISEGLDRSSKIVKSLLAFTSKGGTGVEESDINEIIDNTLLFMKTEISNDIKIIKTYNLDDEVPVILDKMHQVFHNIFDNAIFEFKQTNVKDKALEIKTYCNNNTAIIEIHNNASKIDTKIIQEIFDPFFTTKDPDKGVGLGLTSCFNIIKEHEGDIAVKNTSTGVCFTISIPIHT